jgi:phosphomannomutase
MPAHRFNPVILREYDVRGTYGRTLSEADARALGQSFGTILRREGGNNRRVCVGYDGRVSSPALEGALVEGLISTGLEVLRVGRGPTPLLYYSVFHTNAGGGVMVTGSHNPPDQNGFKLMLGRKAFHGINIARLGPITAAADFESGIGSAAAIDPRQDYFAELMQGFSSGGRPLTVAWDPGNGAAGEIVADLAKRLPGRHIAVNTVIDGTFPVHHPDPAVEKNLAQVKDLVAKNNCDVGLAFDGDGDRLGVIDSAGNTVMPDQLLALFAADVLRANPGASVIADVKSSQMLFDEIARLGGKPVMWRTGHALIKDKLAELRAPLAGELSGHMFFADRYYGFDDALYSAVRLLALLANGKENLYTLVKQLPKWVNTAEVRVHCEEDRKFSVITELKERLRAKGALVIDIDGVRVSTADGWWLVRASNTEAALVIRAEARDARGLGRVQAALKSELGLSGVSMVAASH